MAPQKLPIPHHIRNFCINFVSDYFYRLHSVSETHVFKNGKNRQTYDRPKFSTEGALFVIGLAQMESGWGAHQAESHHNFWGMHGKTADTLSQFPSLETGMGFWFNHMQRGINGDATDNRGNPGWPAFLKLMESPKIATDDINKSLDSGPYCMKTSHPYNFGGDPSCRKENLQAYKGCPCVNYAGLIRESSVNAVVSYCLRAYDDAEKNPLPVGTERGSAVYPTIPGRPRDNSIPDAATRLALTRTELLNYAKSTCGISTPVATSGISPEIETALSSAEAGRTRAVGSSRNDSTCKP